MIIVREWKFKEVPRPNTRLWVSEVVVDALADLDGSERNRIAKLLKRYMERGFWNFIAEFDCPIKSEHGIAKGVYRIKYELFRIIGFFDGNDHTPFIAIDAFLKHGQDVSEPEKERIRSVGKVKESRAWRKNE